MVVLSQSLLSLCVFFLDPTLCHGYNYNSGIYPCSTIDLAYIPPNISDSTWHSTNVHLWKSRNPMLALFSLFISLIPLLLLLWTSFEAATSFACHHHPRSISSDSLTTFNLRPYLIKELPACKKQSCKIVNRKERLVTMVIISCLWKPCKYNTINYYLF